MDFRDTFDHEGEQGIDGLFQDSVGRFRCQIPAYSPLYFCNNYIIGLYIVYRHYKRMDLTLLSRTGTGERSIKALGSR